jgi:hypothetical protein
MTPFPLGFLTCLSGFFRSRYNLSLEVCALRQQLGVLKRSTLVDLRGQRIRANDGMERQWTKRYKE